MRNAAKGSYALRIPITTDELEALAQMADDDLRDLRTEAWFSVRRIMIERGYLPGPATNTDAPA